MTDYKYDAGKVKANILFEDFPLALLAVAEVATFGADKYARHSWKGVDNAKQRYGDAFARHVLEQHVDKRDNESGLLHKAHLAWNALALLQLEMDEQRAAEEKWSEELDKTTASKVLNDAVPTIEINREWGIIASALEDMGKRR